MSNDLVSIITPNYNGEKFIGRTIESIIAQKYTNWELLITDDCSTDSSVEIIKYYTQIDNRIKLFQLEKNSGVPSARNTSIKNATGRYLAFCDGDDLWSPEKLSVQIQMMQEKGYGFTYTPFAIVDENDDIIKFEVKCPDVVDFKRLTSGNPIMCSTVVLDREQTGEIVVPQFKLAQDYATWGAIMRGTGIKAYCTEEVLAKYRKSEGSLSAKKLLASSYTWRINRDFFHMNFFQNFSKNFIYLFRWIKKHYIGTAG